MRLNPGITLADADQALRDAATQWTNTSGGAQNYFSAVDAIYPQLRRVFAEPDLAGGLRSAGYWNLLALSDSRGQARVIRDPDVAGNQLSRLRALNEGFAMEVSDQVAALGRARRQLDRLTVLAGRPGLPIIYDTNMLLAWQPPGDIDWPQTLRDQGEQATAARIIVPLRVVDELDRQKNGTGSELPKRATAAIRYLERTLAVAGPGQAVPLRGKVTLEVWTQSDPRGLDADLAILECAAEVAALCPSTGVRVLTGDFGMRMRARQLELGVLDLPDPKYRKPSPAAPTATAPAVTETP